MAAHWVASMLLIIKRAGTRIAGLSIDVYKKGLFLWLVVSSKMYVHKGHPDTPYPEQYPLLRVVLYQAYEMQQVIEYLVLSHISHSPSSCLDPFIHL